MTSYEQQVLNTEQYYNMEMQLVELEDQEILPSYVTGDRLHEKIHNPIQEGIDEG
ncbi:MAG: hypothetical protein OQL19_19130 [Gammaproteobacteria bacterium]|nr:hypothetical protein [Gammaproteobacteria bacterium]